MSNRADNDDGTVEHGVSFGGPHPPEELYVPMPDYASARRLYDVLYTAAERLRCPRCGDDCVYVTIASNNTKSIGRD